MKRLLFGSLCLLAVFLVASPAPRHWLFGAAMAVAISPMAWRGWGRAWPVGAPKQGRQWPDMVEAGPYAASGIDMVALAWVAGVVLLVLAVLGAVAWVCFP